MVKFDEIFDDVVVNAKAAASVVSKKASAFYDTSKHKISAAEVRGEINKKLKELGTYTYKSEVHGQDLSAEITKTVAEIQELKEALAVIIEHIEETKNQKKCPSCGAKIAKNAVFCHICGINISDAETVPVDDFDEPAEEEANEAEHETFAVAPGDTFEAAEDVSDEEETGPAADYYEPEQL